MGSQRFKRHVHGVHMMCWQWQSSNSSLCLVQSACLFWHCKKSKRSALCASMKYPIICSWSTAISISMILSISFHFMHTQWYLGYVRIHLCSFYPPHPHPANIHVSHLINIDIDHGGCCRRHAQAHMSLMSSLEVSHFTLKTENLNFSRKESWREKV